MQTSRKDRKKKKKKSNQFHSHTHIIYDCVSFFPFAQCLPLICMLCLPFRMQRFFPLLSSILSFIFDQKFTRKRNAYFCSWKKINFFHFSLATFCHTMSWTHFCKSDRVYWNVIIHQTKRKKNNNTRSEIKYISFLHFWLDAVAFAAYNKWTDSHANDTR